MEEFQGCVPEDMKICLNERKVESNYDMAILADEYIITHRKGKIIKLIGSAQPNHKLNYPNSENCDIVHRPPRLHPSFHINRPLFR